MWNSFLGNTPISREPLVRISPNLAHKYRRKQVTGMLKKLENYLTEAILDIPVNLLQRIIKNLSIKLNY